QFARHHRHQGLSGGHRRRAGFDRGRGGRGRHHRTAGELRGIHRWPVPARRQHVHGRTVLRAHHHPDDPPLRPVRHREHRADVTLQRPGGFSLKLGPVRSASHQTQTDAHYPMSYVPYPRPCGDFRTSYAADMTMFRTRGAMIMACAGVALLLALPLFASDYVLSQLILIGIYGIAALGLNVLVGFTGQISLGHSAFFGFGAFASAWLGTKHGVPPLISIPIAGVMTTALGMVFGIPAARLKGLYLAIATLAAQ